jgi:predicted lipoprotein with Yx(FWY)xxD motif
MHTIAGSLRVVPRPTVRCAVAVAAAVAFAACSGGSGGSTPAAAPLTSVVITTGHAQAISSVLATGTGADLYANAQERGNKVDCTGNCLSTWPLLIVTTAAAVHVPKTSVVQRSLIGTIVAKSGGFVVTYAGYPLHTYVGDGASSGNGEGIQGFFVVSAPGRLVKSDR